MLKISDAVRQIIRQDEIALEATRREILNFSAYADQIIDQVEEDTVKKVKKGSIVVALSRIAPEVRNTPSIKPEVLLDDLSIKSPLADITYEKTRDNLLRVQTLQDQLPREHRAFLMITEGASQITILVPAEYQTLVLAHFQAEPVGLYSDLVGLTVGFAEEYIHTPNIIYSILGAVAVAKINLVEVVSTYTELTLVIEKQDLEQAVSVLQSYFQPQAT